MNNSLILTRYNRAKGCCPTIDATNGCLPLPTPNREEEKSFSLQDFLERNNKELINSYQLLITRTISKIRLYYNAVIPYGTIHPILQDNIALIYNDVGTKIEAGQYQAALEVILELIRYGNRYLDLNEPLQPNATDSEAYSHSLLHSVQVIANLAVLLHPFLPFSLEKVFQALSLRKEWHPQYVNSGYPLPEAMEQFETA